jgi:hypothetical protein
MFPNVAIVCRHAGPTAVTDPASTRRLGLAAEARRVARRRVIAEVVARRSQENDRALPPDASTQLSHRARTRATRLSLGFHRAIEALWSADGFDEALAIFREHKAEYTRRASASRFARQG